MGRRNPRHHETAADRQGVAPADGQRPARGQAAPYEPHHPTDPEGNGHQHPRQRPLHDGGAREQRGGQGHQDRHRDQRGGEGARQAGPQRSRHRATAPTRQRQRPHTQHAGGRRRQGRLDGRRLLGHASELPPGVQGDHRRGDLRAHVARRVPRGRAGPLEADAEQLVDRGAGPAAERAPGQRGVPQQVVAEVVLAAGRLERAGERDRGRAVAVGTHQLAVLQDRLVAEGGLEVVRDRPQRLGAGAGREGRHGSAGGRRRRGDVGASPHEVDERQGQRGGDDDQQDGEDTGRRTSHGCDARNSRPSGGSPASAVSGPPLRRGGRALSPWRVGPVSPAGMTTRPPSLRTVEA